MKPFVFACCLIFASLSMAFATHLRGGIITVERSDENSLSCTITITVYTNTKNTPVKFGGDPDLSYLHFGDGNKIYVPEIENTIRYDIDPSGRIATASFTADHTYASEGAYVVSYQEPNRNAGVVNAANSINSLFYLKTYFNLNSDFRLTPSSLTLPIFYGVLGNDFTASLASYGEDFSYFYELTTPKKNENESLEDYELPENFEINKFSGLISWDTKFQGLFQAGEYAFAAKVLQFKADVLVSYAIIDFQVILVEQSSNETITGDKETDANGRIYIPQTTTQKVKIFAENPQAGGISLNAFTELENESAFPDAFSFSTYDSINGDRKIKVGVLQLASTDQVLLRDNPFAVVVRATYEFLNDQVYKDLSYLVYFKDEELEYPEIILQAEDEGVYGGSYFPNPVKDFLFLEFKDLNAIKLYDTEGRIAFEATNHIEPFIDFRNMKKGIYLLRLKSKNNKSVAVKVMKD